MPRKPRNSVSRACFLKLSWPITLVLLVSCYHTFNLSPKFQSLRRNTTANSNGLVCQAAGGAPNTILHTFTRAPPSLVWPIEDSAHTLFQIIMFNTNQTRDTHTRAPDASSRILTCRRSSIFRPFHTIQKGSQFMELISRVTVIGQPFLGSRCVWQIFCGPVFSVVHFLGWLLLLSCGLLHTITAYYMCNF